MILKKDIDQEWIEEDFGTGTEKYLVRRWAGKIIDELAHKHNSGFKALQFVAKVPGLKKLASRIIVRKSAAWEADVYDWIIQDWDGILEPDETKAECNRKNKILLIETSEKRKNWILTKASLPGTFDNKTEELVKNLWKPSNMNLPTQETKNSPQAAASA